MAKEFLYSFPNQIFTVGQQLAFQFKDKKMLLLLVKDIEGNLSYSLSYLFPMDILIYQDTLNVYH